MKHSHNNKTNERKLSTDVLHGVVGKCLIWFGKKESEEI